MEEINKIAQHNFELWTQSLLTKDPKKVAELYSLDTTFLPTMSPEFKKGIQGAEEYFRHFLEKNPAGKLIEGEVQSLGKDVYLHCGMYDFEVGKPENREIVHARFSFVWRKRPDGKWEIIHHHSSVKPK